MWQIKYFKKCGPKISKLDKKKEVLKTKRSIKFSNIQAR